MQTHKSLSTLF